MKCDKMSRFVGRAEDRDESERMTREEAEDLAAKMIKVLTPYVDFIEVCGSYRRGREDPGDLDIVIIIKEGYTLPEIVSDLESSGLYTAVNWLGEKKTQIVVDDVKVDIKVSTTEGLGAALLYFTGPSGYNIGMRRAAKSRGMKLNEYGIWDRDTNTYLGGATEEEIYEIMDKTFKPAHKRAESFEASEGFCPSCGETDLMIQYYEDSGDFGCLECGNQWFEADTDGYGRPNGSEYLVEIRNTRGDVLWRSPCPDYDYLVKEINHMLKTHYYAIDVFTNEYGRKNHMATIKYGKAESGPLAAKLNESLIFRAESFESETVDWTEADLFVDWLKDENIIFHELTNRTHKGQNYGAFRRWESNHGLLRPTKALWEESNFHIFEETSPEVMHQDSLYPFALKAEEGLQIMAGELSRFLLEELQKAALGLDIDWDDTTIIVDLSDAVAEDQLIMLFPDDSEIELSLNNPKIEFLYDVIDDTAELDWVVGLKITSVDGNYDF